MSSASAPRRDDRPTPALTPRADSSRGGVNRAWLRALETTARLVGDPGATLAAVVDDLGDRFAGAPALVSDRQSFSFEDMAAQCRRYTRWARDQGLGPGDVVALLAPNSPDYFNIWVGITRTGATVALLNTNQLDRALAHAIRVAGAAHLILAPAFAPAYLGAATHLQQPPRLWLTDEPDADAIAGAERLDVRARSGAPLEPAERGGAGLADRALQIYTSGTTGPPKAANVSHRRVLTWCGWFAGLMDAGPQDRLYACLPMHHSVGGVVAIGGALMNGGSVVVRESFSASQFWSDIVRFDCTLFQYIGELCRYLLAQPPHPDETRHRLRLACGNGLREQVWTAFQTRFNVPAIVEFYAATEGSFSLFNVEGRPGAIGRVPPFLAHRFAGVVVRFDPDAEAPARDGEGRCTRCAPGEVGEAIGRLASDARTDDGGGRFEGYTDAGETERKILRDVFQPGDAWFRTGDLMRKDEAGFFYFVDRIGDSFRWKGENVSSGEVADALCACPGVSSAVVYGVQVPGAEGRAGMAAMVVDRDFDPAALTRHLNTRLARYARPVFIRLVERLDSTETFKLKKQALVRQGFDPAACGGAVWFDPSGGGYVPLDPAAYRDIQAERIRL